MIGVVGGLGPYAGLDLVRKVFDATPARRDQDHLPVALISVPHRVADRTAFLLGYIAENPGAAIADVVLQLVANGAEVVGIPCNTAHAPPIFDVVQRRAAGRCDLVHMVAEVGADLAHRFPSTRRVGVLCTTGTLVSGIYPCLLNAADIEVVQLPLALQERYVQSAIYDPTFGIKAAANPVDGRAVERLRSALRYLVDRGAEVVVLACTEIPLALAGPEDVPLIDATEVLARALVRRSLPPDRC
jgi:aspartate racemase